MPLTRELITSDLVTPEGVIIEHRKFENFVVKNYPDGTSELIFLQALPDAINQSLPKMTQFDCTKRKPNISDPRYQF